MTVRILTDSLSDLSPDHNIDELGITVVPLTVRFGTETYLDRVTITTDEFYRRLIGGSVWPASTQPSPQDFANAYDKAAADTDEILVVTLSSKLSGTYQSAKAGIELKKNKKCRVEVIDSLTVAMGLGLVVLAAAKEAKNGVKLDKLVDFTKKALTRSHFIAYFDTLKYLAKGGRIGKAAGLVGSVLSVKPILSTKGGEMSPVTRLRSRAAGMEYLYNFMVGFKKIEMVGVEHTTDKEGFDAIAKRFSAVYPNIPVIRSTVSPVLGVYGAANAGAVTVLEAEAK
jgi:DegV family protein with EDD domain